jgi:hypothetical protein
MSREELAKEMTAAQIAEAQRLSGRWCIWPAIGIGAILVGGLLRVRRSSWLKVCAGGPRVAVACGRLVIPKVTFDPVPVG